MEQIEAGKRKSNKDRQKREYKKEEKDSKNCNSEHRSSLYSETAKGNKRRVQNSTVNQTIQSLKLDNSVKDKNKNIASNDSATTSEMTSPGFENAEYLLPYSSSDNPTRKEALGSEYQKNLNDMDDELIRFSPSPCGRSSANTSNMQEENSWDHMNQIEITAGRHRNRRDGKNMNYSENDTKILEHTLLADAHIVKDNDEVDEFAQYHPKNESSGKLH